MFLIPQLALRTLLVLSISGVNDFGGNFCSVAAAAAAVADDGGSGLGCVFETGNPGGSL